MRDVILDILVAWSRTGRAMPWRSGLLGALAAFVVIAYLAAIARSRFELRAMRVSTGPLFALAGVIVFALGAVVALADAILAWQDMPLVEERILLFFAPGEGQAAYEELRRLLGILEGGRFILPGSVHVPLSLFFAGILYIGIVFWAARTLEEMASIEQKPDDVLAKERAEEEKKIKKAIAEGRPLPTAPASSIPLADDRFGRVFKMLGHWTSVEFVEDRFLRWQGPLVFSVTGLLLLALPSALGGHLSAPLWVGSAILLDGLRRNLATPTKPPAKPPAEPAAPEKTQRPPIQPLILAVHEAEGPLLLPPKQPEAAPGQLSPGTDLRAKRMLDDLARELGALRGLYVHQGLTGDAFAARKNILLSTPPLSGKTTTLELLLFYSLLVDAEAVLWIAPSAAEAAIAERRVLARAEALRWKWNVHSANLAVSKGTVDPTHGNPALIFADPAGIHRELCGRQQEWSGFLGGLGLVIVPDLDEWQGPSGAHLSLLLRRLRRAVSRCAPVPPGAKPPGERIRCLMTADPVFRDLGQFAERIIGRPVLQLGPEVSAAPRPPAVSYCLPPAARPDRDYHPAVRILGEALAHGFSAELFGYEDVLSRADVARANEWSLGRGVATRGRSFAAERDEANAALAGAEVVIARLRADRYALSQTLVAHVGFRAATIPDARMASLGAGERVGKAILPRMPVAEEPSADKPQIGEGQTELQGQLNAEGIAAQEVERKVLVLWQPDPDPLSALLAHERPPFDHPDFALGQTIVVDPLADAIQRVHLHAALAEAAWSMEELVQDFSRPVVRAEIDAMRNAGEASSTSLREETRIVLDSARGTRQDVSMFSLSLGEPPEAMRFDVAGEPAEVVDRHTGDVLFGVERARMLSAAYPGRIFVLRGGRYVVKPLEEQDGIEQGRVACEREERWLVTSPIRVVDCKPIERRVSGNAARAGNAERRAEPTRSIGGAAFYFERRLVDIEETVLGVRRYGPDGRERDTTMYAEPIVHRYSSKATLLGFPKETFGEISPAALHALTHLFRVTLSAFVAHREEDLLVVRAKDVGSSLQSGIAFVDAHPGGVGFSEAVTLDVLRVMVGFSLAIVERCPMRCKDASGCSRCVRIVNCHAEQHEMALLDKQGVAELLRKMLKVEPVAT
ncbi:MAG: DUF1998 domain-containing protein [Polyangiaceae bacterium]|nr:DUF1998 domain-containing protein [Polyangiaceae bacterium]